MWKDGNDSFILDVLLAIPRNPLTKMPSLNASQLKPDWSVKKGGDLSL